MRSDALFCLLYLFVVTSVVLGQKRRENRRDRHPLVSSGRTRGQITRTLQRRHNGRNLKTNRDRRQRRGRKHNRRHRKNNHNPKENQESTLSPQDVMETIILPAVCKECKRKDPTFQTCKALCPNLATTDSGRGAVFLGDQYCYFCEYYRSRRSYYQLCRNRFCASGR
ncbi:uncharacterized protein LOC134270326 [Saccostrea cucullata]|uniref:uncharacterized protein LOC134270326 n=1 Tax=Saccostrea cuccullata TaxID=36930 RepID=UPI002ED1EC5A